MPAGSAPDVSSGINFPILQLQELHRSRVFPDINHPSKALNNVFTEKRQGGTFAGLCMPDCRFVLAITSGRDPAFPRTMAG